MNPTQAKLHLLLEDFGKKASSGELILDAGAGKKPYKKHFSHLSYESADLPGNGEHTYQCDLHKIPVEDKRFSLIICNQVLEHVKNPFVVVKELERICKPGGFLFFSVPFYYPEHMIPYDYYRYTRYGAKLLAEQAGFDVESVENVDSYLSMISFQLFQIRKNLPSLEEFVKKDLCSDDIAISYSNLTKQFSSISKDLSNIEMQLVNQNLPYPSEGHPRTFYVIAKKRI